MSWLSMLAGSMLVAWALYQYHRLRRRGEISALHDLPLEAGIDDHPVWLWFIILVNGAYLLFGLIMMVDGFSELYLRSA